MIEFRKAWLWLFIYYICLMVFVQITVPLP